MAVIGLSTHETKEIWYKAANVVSGCLLLQGRPTLTRRCHISIGNSQYWVVEVQEKGCHHTWKKRTMLSMVQSNL